MTRTSSTRHVFLFWLIGIAICGCSPQGDVDSLYANALAAFERADLDATNSELKELLWLDPRHARARLLLARTLLSAGDLSGANAAVDAAIDLGLAGRDVAQVKAEVRLALGQYDAVLADLNDGRLDTLPAVRRLELRARSMLGLGAISDAERVLEQALTAAPDDESLHALRAELLIEAGRVGEAAAEVDALLGRHPDSARGWFSRGTILRRQGDHAAAIDAFERVQQAIPGDTERLLAVSAIQRKAESLLATGAVERARRELAVLQQQIPDTPQVYRLSAYIALVTEDYQRASVELQRLLAAVPGDTEGEFLAGITSLARGLTAQAEQYLARVVDRNPSNYLARRYLAQVYARQGQREALIRLLEPAIDQLSVNELLALSAAYVESGRDDAAAQLLLESGALATSSADTQQAAASLMIRAGRYDIGRDMLESLASSSPGAVLPKVGLVNLDRLEGRTTEGLAAVRELAQEDPDNLVVIVLGAQLALESGDLDEAETWLARADAVDEDALLTSSLHVALAAARGDTEGALAAARQIVSDHPDMAHGYRLQGAFELRQGDVDAAIASLTRAVRLDPAGASARLALAQLLVSTGRLEPAEEQLDEIVLLGRVSMASEVLLARIESATGRVDDAIARARNLSNRFRERFEPALLLGDLLAGAGRLQDAAAAFNDAMTRGAGARAAIGLFRVATLAGGGRPERPLIDFLETEPTSVLARFALATHYQTSGALAAARDQYRLLANQEPADPTILNNLAWVTYELGEAGAADTARAAYEAAPENPAIADTLGWILASTGDRSGIEYLESAVAAAPDNSDIRYHLGVSLSRFGEQERARQVLADLARADPEFAAARGVEQLIATLGGEG